MKHHCYKTTSLQRPFLPCTHAGYRFDVKVYCNSTQLDYRLENPLYHFLKSNNIEYHGARHVGNYFLIRQRNKIVTEDYLQKHGKLTEFQRPLRYGYRLPTDDVVSVTYSGIQSTIDFPYALWRIHGSTQVDHAHLTTPTCLHPLDHTHLSTPT